MSIEPKPYQTSSTSVAKSQEEIRRLLSRYGADGVQFSEDWKAMILQIRFLYRVGNIQHSLLYAVPIPKAQPVSEKGRPRTAKQVEVLQEQLERGVWRAVFWNIKSGMEAVAFGIKNFESAFLSHFEIPNSNKTIGDVIIPRLAAGKLTLQLDNKS
jgi:hypothetical protein